MSLTTDGNDPELHEDRGDGQNKKYIVLSDEERAKGFVRPVRNGYIHVGMPEPKTPLRYLTTKEAEEFKQYGYVAYEEYPAGSSSLGRYWTEAEIASVGKGCGTMTIMVKAIAETYAREPRFYGATYCMGCRKHLPVGEHGEFVWADAEDERVGT